MGNDMVEKIRILYAEDNALDADLTRVHFELEAPDFHLDIVDNGAACLRQLTAQPYAALLLDNHLPDTDGLDLLLVLRAAGHLLPVVMVTGVGDDETVARALRAGASDYVPKAGDYLQSVPALLRALIARRQERMLREDADSWRDQHVLYIEPNGMDAELTQQHFANQAPHLKLQLLDNCMDALAVLSAPHNIDLVLTDLRVPGMDALEFIHEVKRRQIDVPFVVITGKGDEATAVALLRLGASDYLVKRDNYLVQLPHAIEHALHRFRLDRSNQRLHAQWQVLNASLELKVAQRTAELQATQHSLRATFDAVPDLVWQKDLQGRYQAGNVAMERLLGRAMGQCMGQCDADLFDLPFALALRAHDQSVLETSRPAVQELYLPMAGTANVVLFEVINTPMLGEHGELVGLLGVARDITERKANEDRIQQLAYFDALTGLPNRLLLRDRSHYALSVAQRNQTALTVMMLDLDNFKHVNDNLGHDTGDLMLVEIAKRLSAAMREEDTVSRLGGDEFLLLLPGGDPVGAIHVANKLIETLSHRCQVGEHALVVTPSIGIAVYPQDGTDFESLSKHAEMAMYRAKSAGRNQFCFFTEDMQTRSGRVLQLETDLRQAIKNNELLLHFQPQWSMQTRRILGVEALLRWQHPTMGLVSPAEFIPIAEATGQIVAIGEWVLRQALSQLKRWMADGIEPLTMSVNLSAVQFRRAHLPDMVCNLLQELQVSPDLLQLELTESAMMHDPQNAIDIVTELHRRGIAMSIDDFGTGYSSLAYLKSFKAAQLKIDQTFVRDLAHNADTRAIVAAIVRLSRDLAIQTIAEGVETEVQLTLLAQLGCDAVQGYYLSRPIPAAELLTLLRRKPVFELP